METIEECIGYVERIIRRKTIKYAPDIRDDILADAALHMVKIWPRCKKPVSKEYLKKTFGLFAAKQAGRYLNDIHLPQYYGDKGITTADDIDNIKDKLPRLTDKNVYAITHALMRQNKNEDPAYVSQSGCWGDGDNYEHVDQSTTPDEIVERRDFIEKALDSLTETEQDLLVRLYVYEKQQSDIAREEGVSREAIRLRTNKVLAKLRERMK